MDLVLFIAKGLVPFFFVESPFLQRLVLRQNPSIDFPSMHQLMNNILSMLAKTTKEKFIHEVLESCDTFPMSFDLWMSRGGRHFCFDCSFFEPQIGSLIM
jgi:hypothetical protein